MPNSSCKIVIPIENSLAGRVADIHYLLPKGYIVGKGDGFLDSSGFDLYTDVPRNVDSHLFGLFLTQCTGQPK